MKHHLLSFLFIVSIIFQGTSQTNISITSTVTDPAGLLLVDVLVTLEILDCADTLIVTGYTNTNGLFIHSFDGCSQGMVNATVDCDSLSNYTVSWSPVDTMVVLNMLCELACSTLMNVYPGDGGAGVCITGWATVPHGLFDFELDMGDGENYFFTGSNVFAKCHEYTELGTYTICITSLDQFDNTCVICQDYEVTDCFGEISANATTDATTFQFDYDGITDSLTSYVWDFGDGETSTTAAPVHSYDTSGIYTVIYTMTDMNGISCTKEIDVLASTSPILNIMGCLSAADDSTIVFIGDAIVYLITYDSLLSELIIVDSVITIGCSAYLFYDVPNGDYIIRAELLETAEEYGNYAPTYYHQELMWGDAQHVVTDGLYDLFIADIIMINESEFNGSGTVSGYIVEQDNESENASGILVSVLDLNNILVAFSFTDEQGAFLINDLASGSYNFHVECMGKTTQLLAISLTEDENSINNIEVYINEGSVVSTLTPNAVNEINGSIVLYENPVNETARFSLNIKNAGELHVALVALNGSVVRTINKIVFEGDHTIDISVYDLNPGIYMIQMQLNGLSLFQTKIIKL